MLDFIDAKQPRGVRNRNPGNLRKSSVQWSGEVAGEDQSFCTFDTPENGIRALAKVLLAYYRKHGLNTVEKIIMRYAPANENDTAAYAAHVARALSVGVADPLKVEDPETLKALCKVICRHENGTWPYTAEILNEGVRRALA